MSRRKHITITMLDGETFTSKTGYEGLVRALKGASMFTSKKSIATFIEGAEARLRRMLPKALAAKLKINVDWDAPDTEGLCRSFIGGLLASGLAVPDLERGRKWSLKGS